MMKTSKRYEEYENMLAQCDEEESEHAMMNFLFRMTSDEQLTHGEYEILMRKYDVIEMEFKARGIM